MKWLLKLGLKFVSFDTLVKTIASGLAYIMEYARKNSSLDGWEKAKVAIKQIKNWTALIDEVYEDDTLTPEEEKKIQEAIANCTVTSTIYDMLQGKKKPKKVAEKKPTTKKKPSKATKKVGGANK